MKCSSDNNCAKIIERSVERDAINVTLASAKCHGGVMEYKTLCGR